MDETLLEAIHGKLNEALNFDPNVKEAPIGLLWTDETGEWSEVVSALQPEICVLRFGDPDQGAFAGSSHWIRCALAGTVELEATGVMPPVVYLEGVSRSVFRDIPDLANDLAPLASLQFRCDWFAQPGGKDWTLRSFLSNSAKGLGLEVAQDAATAGALAAAVPMLLKRSLASLRGRVIDAVFLNSLINPDHHKLVLDWLDAPSEIRSRMSPGEWTAFCQQCQSDLGFDPDSDGELRAAELLAGSEGDWAQVWERFRSAPRDYPGIPDRLRQVTPSLAPVNPGAWPAAAVEAEEQVRAQLMSLMNAAPQEARTAVTKLARTYEPNREYVWAELGWTPLVSALGHLCDVATSTGSGPAGDSVEAIRDWYGAGGWKADAAVVATLASLETKTDRDAVQQALSAVYVPWLDQHAKALQAAIGPALNAGTYIADPPPALGEGEVVVFVDGLRLDCAHLLLERLAAVGLDVDLSVGLAALPTVTQCAKPALVPIDQNLLGAGDGLDACRAPDGPSATVQVLRSMLDATGVQVLQGAEVGDPAGTAWTEAGQIDHRGHDQGAAMPQVLDAEIGAISARVRDLLAHGWQKVTVVTDHGWLLLPGGLPKNNDLPAAQTEVKKGRCARLKDGAQAQVPTVPWHWDQQVQIAAAPGISCFEANKDYEHGGVSPQECFVPRLAVVGANSAPAGVDIASFKWRNLSLAVEFDSLPEGALPDLRTAAADASTSVAERMRPTTSEKVKYVLLVLDEDLEDSPVQFVVVSGDGAILLQRQVTIGRNE